jgi:hypothetical protein
MASRKSSGSPSTTSGPPSASSWAAPPEFYLDENIAGRTIAHALRVHRQHGRWVFTEL